MGVDSGLPDYRGNEGLWRAYPRLKHLGLSFESMANPSWFERNPRMAWAFYGHRRQLYRETPPHRGYSLLRQWGDTLPHGYFVFTSNVDGHFERAGFRGDRLVECHGTVHLNQCCEPCHDALWNDAAATPDIDLDKLEMRGPLPACPECGTVSRPNVLMFGDWNWIADRTARQHALYSDWLEALRAGEARVAIVELGAGTRLDTVRRESERLAAALRGTLVRINPREAAGPDGTVSIALPALEALERIEAVLSAESGAGGAPEERCGEPAVDCPFCDAPPERVIAASDAVLALFDGYPVSPGHALVVPRRHVASSDELTAEEKDAIWQMVDAVRGRLAERYRPSAFNVGFNDGAAAGQTVMHFHVHVIPRYAGDAPDPRGGIRWVLPDKAAYWSAETDD